MNEKALDYKQHLVLFVEDEQRTRKYFSKLFGKDFRVVLAEDGAEGLERFREHQDEIGVVVTDQRMPNESGTSFLEKVALLKPNVVRILSTAYADIDSAMDAVNRGGIYRYVTKPWEVAELEVTLKRAMELYMVGLEREELVRQKTQSVEVLAASDRVVSLAALATFRESGLRHVGEALKAVVRLSEGSGENSGPEVIGSERLSWRELYRRHLSFLGAVSASLPRDLTELAALDFSERIGVKEVLDPIVADLPGLEWGEHRATPQDWPGPLADTQAVVGPFFSALAEAARAKGVVRVEESLSGLEIALPGDAISSILAPAVSSSAEEPSRLALELIAGCLRIAHQGGVFDLLPEPEQVAPRLRIGFDASRVERVPDDPYEELAAELVGNELFWSRVVD